MYYVLSNRSHFPYVAVTELLGRQIADQPYVVYVSIRSLSETI